MDPDPGGPETSGSPNTECIQAIYYEVKAPDLGLDAGKTEEGQDGVVEEGGCLAATPVRVDEDQEAAGSAPRGYRPTHQAAPVRDDLRVPVHQRHLK